VSSETTRVAGPRSVVDDATDGREGPLAELYADMARGDVQALWTQPASLMPESPRPRALPWLWSWESMLALAERAGELVPVERGGDRRVLAFSNPGLGGTPFATGTLWGALQYLNAGESAPAHRHAAAAIRFVLQGEGVWTTVNGEPCPMAPGDLVLTPSMAWHEHHSDSHEPMVWFDGLDLPLVNALDANFFETAPTDYLGDLDHRPDRSRSADMYGHAGLRPELLPETDRHSPLMVYRWSNTDRALTGIMQATGRGAATVTFTDPVTGRDALPTMRCAVRRLRPGVRTASTRSVGSSVIVVSGGSGQSVIDGLRLAWTRGDVMAVPSWATVDHEAFDEADLFVVSDAPVVEALRLDRTETLPHVQAVVRDWGEGADPPARGTGR
jgi:gentisate 1,2-dioxygenase